MTDDTAMDGSLAVHWFGRHPEPSVLVFRSGPADAGRAPFFSRREVVAGPDVTDRVDGDRVRSLKTSPDLWDVGAVLARLPTHQRPDVIVVETDGRDGLLPCNLDRFDGAKVLLFNESFSVHSAIRNVLSYASAGSFDLIVVAGNRRHAAFFRDAGFERVCWIPALGYRLHRPVMAERFEPVLAVIKRPGGFHPRHRAFIDTAVRAGLPVRLCDGTLPEIAEVFARACITLGGGADGDMDARLFETLGSGGFLLTGEPAPDSGFTRLFESGRHAVTVQKPDDLVEMALQFLCSPERTRPIRTAAQAHVLATQSPELKLCQLYDALFDGRIDTAIALDDVTTSRHFARETAARRLDAYEALRGLSLTLGQGAVLWVDLGDALGLGVNARALSGITPANYDGPVSASATRHEVLALPWPEAAAAVEDGLLVRFRGEWVLTSGRCWPDRLAVAHLLREWGFLPDGPTGLTFRRTDPLLHAEAVFRRDPTAVGPLLMGLQPAIETPEAALRAAALARNVGLSVLEASILERGLSLDRGHDGALLAFAKRAEADGRTADAYLAVAELARQRSVGHGLPVELSAVLGVLRARAAADPRVAEHQAALLPPAVQAGHRRRILVVTNLFPPQEFGGYGRKLWEFSAELKRRGHEIHVLAADVPELSKPGMAGTVDLEPFVERSLELYGQWREGRAHVFEDMTRVGSIIRANDQRIRDAAKRFGAEICLAGNIDLMTPNCLAQLPQCGVPVLHCVGNRHPGYAADGAPESALYRIGPASEWVGRTLWNAGFCFPAMTVLYPGARIDHFYRPFLPGRDRLRVVFASLFVNYKGPHVLANALALLHRWGVDFTCVFAGDRPDPNLFADIRDYCARQGFADKVTYPGFLDREGLARLFDRSNVLVFPSSFDEPFGISQVEAMAAGLTVVSSGTGGSQEIVRDGIDGVLFAVNDPEQLAIKLKGLVEDPDGWARLARAGQQRAFSFTVARTVDRIEATFEDLLALV
ncbi:glycosyltransferase [Azospirillum sp.]|uniref:glycosyltransferase n=1 Tax=Azospirillum sp. TaxID=34012 RepID=UPI00262AE85B|nr:glycosyltransferase [Azospirillum sp.]